MVVLAHPPTDDDCRAGEECLNSGESECGCAAVIFLIDCPVVAAEDDCLQSPLHASSVPRIPACRRELDQVSSDEQQEEAPLSLLRSQQAQSDEFDSGRPSVRKRCGIDSRSTGKDTLNILVKKGDDLRKDEIIAEIILLLSFLLESKGVHSYFQYYACMATSGDEGLIEIVDDAITIGSLYDQSNTTDAKTGGYEQSHSF